MKEIASISLAAKSSIPILSCSRITDLNIAFTKPDRPRVNFFANLTDSLTAALSGGQFFYRTLGKMHDNSI